MSKSSSSSPTIKEMIQTLQNMCMTQMEGLVQRIDDVDRKCTGLAQQLGEVKNTIDTLTLSSASSGTGSTFMSIENKVDYLNQQFGNSIPQESLLTFIQREVDVKEKDVEMILKGSASIYDVCATRLVELVDRYDGKTHFLYAFAFQKYTVYFWNHDHEGTWERMSIKEACSIFEVVQQKLIGMYTIMVQENHDGIRGVDVVDYGDRLFVDNFDKKYAEFKKLLFNGLTHGGV